MESEDAAHDRYRSLKYASHDKRSWRMRKKKGLRSALLVVLVLGGLVGAYGVRLLAQDERPHEKPDDYVR